MALKATDQPFESVSCCHQWRRFSTDQHITCGQPAFLWGTVDLTGLSYPTAFGVLTQHVFAGTTDITVTYASPATPAAAAAALQAAITAGTTSKVIVSLQGDTWPAKAPNTITGTVDLGGLTYPTDFGTKTLTLFIGPPERCDRVDVTFASPATSVAAVNAINTAIRAACGGVQMAEAKLAGSLVLTGTVDMTGLSYPTDLGVKTLKIYNWNEALDAEQLTTVTFASPADAPAAVAQINAALVANGSPVVASLSATNRLVLTSTTVATVDHVTGTATTIVNEVTVGAGTLALATIGMTAAHTYLRIDGSETESAVTLAAGSLALATIGFASQKNYLVISARGARGVQGSNAARVVDPVSLRVTDGTLTTSTIGFAARNKNCINVGAPIKAIFADSAAALRLLPSVPLSTTTSSVTTTGEYIDEADTGRKGGYELVTLPIGLVWPFAAGGFSTVDSTSGATFVAGF